MPSVRPTRRSSTDFIAAASAVAFARHRLTVAGRLGHPSALEPCPRIQTDVKGHARPHCQDHRPRRALLQAPGRGADPRRPGDARRRSCWRVPAVAVGPEAQDRRSTASFCRRPSRRVCGATTRPRGRLDHRARSPGAADDLRPACLANMPRVMPVGRLDLNSEGLAPADHRRRLETQARAAGDRLDPTLPGAGPRPGSSGRCAGGAGRGRADRRGALRSDPGQAWTGSRAPTPG